MLLFQVTRLNFVQKFRPMCMAFATFSYVVKCVKLVEQAKREVLDREERRERREGRRREEKGAEFDGLSTYASIQR